MTECTKDAARPRLLGCRDLRRALGQFATGVTVITTRAADGRLIGVTANSFTSLSMDPPLVLFCIAKNAPSHAAFQSARHVAIHVLAANQHHISRRFSMPTPDKFRGVKTQEGPSGIPLIDAVLARFVCGNHAQHDGGDHTIFVCEVEKYERFEGDPLVFQSGVYHATYRHPDS